MIFQGGFVRIPTNSTVFSKVGVCTKKTLSFVIFQGGGYQYSYESLFDVFQVGVHTSIPWKTYIFVIFQNWVGLCDFPGWVGTSIPKNPSIL